MEYAKPKRGAAKPYERGGCSDGAEGRTSAGQKPFSEAPEGNSEGGSPGALGRQEAGFVYFIETEDRKILRAARYWTTIIGSNRTA